MIIQAPCTAEEPGLFVQSFLMAVKQPPGSRKGVDRMRLRGNVFLLMAAFFWGTTFVAQMVGMDELGPFSYAAARYLLGFLSLGVVWRCYRGVRERARKLGAYHSGWKAGVQAGCIMFVASSLQQVALLHTTAGKTAFITCLYIIFVPLAAVLLGQRIRPQNWLGAVLALTGLYFLAVRGELALGYGDTLVLLSSFFWTAHILYIDHFASMVDPIELTMAQIGVCTLGSLLVALPMETVTAAALWDSRVAIFYGGVMSAGVAFTCQTIGQKYAEPSHAAIIMSFESIFGAAASWLILGEILSGRELFGCVLMIAGMTITQLKGRI